MTTILGVTLDVCIQLNACDLRLTQMQKSTAAASNWKIVWLKSLADEILEENGGTSSFVYRYSDSRRHVEAQGLC